MVSAARSAGRVLDVAFNHRRRGDVQRLRAGDRRGAPRPHVLRQGVVAAPHRHPQGRLVVHTVRAGGRRAAGRHRRPRARLRPVPARQPGRAHRQRLDLRPARDERVRDVGDLEQDERRRRRGALRRRGPGHGLHAPRRRRHAVTGGQLGRPPGRRRPVRRDPVRNRRRGRVDTSTTTSRSARSSSSATTRAPPPPSRSSAEPGGKHLAVVQEFVDTVRSGDWQGHDGAGAAQLARIVDACYESARERREVTLDAASILNAS